MVTLEALEDEADAGAACGAWSSGTSSYTGSALGRRVLEGWKELAPRFVRVIPNDYRRVLEAQERMRRRG